MPTIFASYPGALETWLAEQHQPPYRRRQIARWLFQRRAGSFAEMSDLPRRLRESLTTQFEFSSTRIVRHSQSSDGTEKLLVRLADGNDIECVLLRDGARRTICISSQVGCAMGCVFCASGLAGVKRNLLTGEIVEQMLHLQRLLDPKERLSHVVVMGMGEPLANLDGLLPALDLARAKEGLGISARRITISTVGLPQAIDRLAGLRSPYHLAISLHAADDRLRNQLVPVNRQVGLDAILQAARRFFDATGRRVTFEYVLLDNVNDGAVHAQQLARRLRGHPALVNLIPYNPVEGLSYRTPSRAAVQRFSSVLTEAGMTVQVRHRKGSQIDAACGQLRRMAGGDAAADSVGERSSAAETGKTLAAGRG